MAFILEFGLKGGAHVDNVVVPTAKLADKLARNLVHVFSNKHLDKCEMWAITNEKHRRTHREWWESDTHFVALTRVGNNSTEGSASSKLWFRKEQS
jgi:hypothetical protein